MQAVTCPQCGKELNVGREVHNVRLRCKSCGTVFLGSTHESGEPSAPSGQGDRVRTPASDSAPADKPATRAVPQTIGHGASRSSHTRHAAAPSRPKSAAPVVLAVLGAIGAIVLIIVAFWLHQNPMVEVWDSETGQYVKKRVSQAEAARLRREEKERRETFGSGDGSNEARRSSDGRSARTGNQTGSRTAGPTGPGVGEVQIKGDKHSRVTDIQLHFSDVGSTGTLTARYTNLADAPVVDAKLTLIAVNEENARRALNTVTVRWVPPGHYVRFSKPFGGFSQEEGYGYIVRVDALRDPNMLCYPVSTKSVGYEILQPEGKGVIELDGQARNLSTKQVMLEPKVIADFYKPDWYHEGAATGKLIGEKTRRLAPGKSVYFRIRYQPEVRYLRNSYEYQIRVVGKKGG